MPKATKTIKISKKTENENDKNDEFKKLLQNVSDDATTKINDLKKKFDKVDVDTKNKIIAGLSVVAAGLVVLLGVNKSKKKK